MMTSVELQVQIFKVLALPAYLWLWCCARLTGGRFEWGPVEDDDPKE